MICLHVNGWNYSENAGLLLLKKCIDGDFPKVGRCVGTVIWSVFATVDWAVEDWRSFWVQIGYLHVAALNAHPKPSKRILDDSDPSTLSLLLSRPLSLLFLGP